LKYRVILQPRALRDLDAQFQHIAQRSPETAARWLNRFLNSLEKLANNPERCSIARESGLVGKEVRQALFGKGRGVRRALFVIDADAVRIVCVRHSAQKDLSAEELLDEIRTTSEGHFPDGSATFTRRLPVLSPPSMPMKALGRFSKPDTMSSRYLSLPSRIQPAIWAAAC
jgi:plasmid stabilization system protein ParE